MGGSDKPDEVRDPGRAGRRVWSRGGNRSTDASGGLATATPGIDRPQTGGLDEADVNRPLHTHGLDDDEDGGDPEVDADIFDDSDDDSWGEETHAGHLRGKQTRPTSSATTKTGATRASPKAMGAVNPSFGGSAIAARSPGGAAEERGFVFGFVSGGGASLPGRQSPLPGSSSSSSFAASREARRRREEEGDFVVMSTPSGLRRVPSARRRPGTGGGGGGGARPGGGGGGGWPSGAGFKDGSGGGKAEVVADVYGAKENASIPPRGASAGGLGLLQRPPSRQRPPPEATNLFARRAAAAAAARRRRLCPG